MNKQPKKRISGILLLFLVILWIPKEGMSDVIWFIRYRGFGIRQIRFLLEVMPRETILTAVLFAAIILLVVGLVRKAGSLFKTETPGLNRPRPVKKDNKPDNPVKSGTARYMTQLDSYLESGLITKEEYRVLKKRYEKIQ